MPGLMPDGKASMLFQHIQLNSVSVRCLYSADSIGGLRVPMPASAADHADEHREKVDEGQHDADDGETLHPP